MGVVSIMLGIGAVYTIGAIAALTALFSTSNNLEVEATPWTPWTFEHWLAGERLDEKPKGCGSFALLSAKRIG